MWFGHVGLPPPIFAAMVPKNAEKMVKDLVEEVMGDHQRLVGCSTVWEFRDSI